jgi:hypothetical protein
MELPSELYIHNVIHKHGNEVPLDFNYKVATKNLIGNGQLSHSVSSPVTDTYWGLSLACSGLVHLTRPYLLRPKNLWLVIMDYIHISHRCRLYSTTYLSGKIFTVLEYLNLRSLPENYNY